MPRTRTKPGPKPDDALTAEERERLEAVSRSAVYRGQFFVSASSPEKLRRLIKLLDKAKTSHLSTACWKAINAYIGEDDFED